MAESGTSLVVAAGDAADADELRKGVADLVVSNVGLADAAVPGRALGGAGSLEDVIRVASRDAGDNQPESDLPDAARELGVVVIVGRPGQGARARVVSAHYVRPIERDGAGHIQRRPPGLLAAWNDAASRLDHFDWGIADELATRARMEWRAFERLHARRTRLIADLAAARVFDRDELRARIESAALLHLAADGESRPDAPN